MKYYLAAVAVPDDYEPDGELINDVDFYFRDGNGYSAIESTNMDCPAYEPKILNKWIGAEVIDKIRAEIEEIAKPNEFGGRGNGKSVRYGLCKALEIIDKYKAEGSDKE